MIKSWSTLARMYVTILWWRCLIGYKDDKKKEKKDEIKDRVICGAVRVYMR